MGTTSHALDTTESPPCGISPRHGHGANSTAIRQPRVTHERPRLVKETRAPLRRVAAGAARHAVRQSKRDWPRAVGGTGRWVSASLGRELVAPEPCRMGQAAAPESELGMVRCHGGGGTHNHTAKGAVMAERMRVEGGTAFVDDGEVTSIDFVAVTISIGRNVQLSDCTFDADCVIQSQDFRP